ncbi:hypothetical protein LSG31_09815 [Fodinisporobacter ferrooxydans]|uniref:Copper amine oxidase-like N-terminal domain-containing protein n=1 Tax=Fodinisporobacter ferrooxydans TaxID=2901836 RepID=A0ABY4CT35_9BACL|nr:hypothetical protein LSG31_09815 [Alicyclobacillaceae bacterium MYW30-H2]
MFPAETKCSFTIRIPKAFIAGLVLGSTLLSSISNPNVYADTNYADTNIYLQGQIISNPKHIIAPDAGDLTSWIPIWYLQLVLDKAGFGGHWDGVTLTIQSSSQPDLSNLPNSQSLSEDSDLLAIAINGTTVEYAPRIVAHDPYADGDTTYVPIYYVMQALNRIGVSSDWDGTNWRMSSNPPSPINNATVTKLSLAKDFVNALQIPIDTNGTSPFDDVSASDWGYVNAISKYLSPDSLTHFGSQDHATVTMLDHAYQLFVGIPDNHMPYNAGGNTVDWATTIGLNKGIASKGNLTGLDETQAVANLTALYYGYRKIDNGYQLVVQPYDMYYDSYDSKKDYVPNPASYQYFTPSVLAEDEKRSIQLLDDTTFTIDNSPYDPTKIPIDNQIHLPIVTFRIDGLSDKDNIGILFGGSYPFQYSINGTSPWVSGGYDSTDPKNGGQDTAPKFVIGKQQGVVRIAVKILENDSTDWYYIAHVGDIGTIGTFYRASLPGSTPSEQGPDTPIFR